MLPVLYVANAALLLVHEIDSAYWREWELLGLPGGEPGFLVVHLPIAALVVWGYGRLVEGARAGALVALLLAGAGLAAAAIHAALLAAGHSEFRAPVSIGILAATLAVSLVQAPLALVSLRTSRPARGRPR